MPLTSSGVTPTDEKAAGCSLNLKGDAIFPLDNSFVTPHGVGRRRMMPPAASLGEAWTRPMRKLVLFLGLKFPVDRNHPDRRHAPAYNHPKNGA